MRSHPPRRLRALPTAVGLTVVALTLAACGPATVQTYQAPSKVGGRAATEHITIPRSAGGGHAAGGSHAHSAHGDATTGGDDTSGSTHSGTAHRTASHEGAGAAPADHATVAGNTTPGGAAGHTGTRPAEPAPGTTIIPNPRLTPTAKAYTPPPEATTPEDDPTTPADGPDPVQGYPLVKHVTCTGTGPWTLSFTVYTSAKHSERYTKVHLTGDDPYLYDWDGVRINRGFTECAD